MVDGKRPVLAIMRPSVYKEESVKLAESMGFDAMAVPMIELTGMQDSSFNPFFQHVVKKEADYVIFTSANGLDFTLTEDSLRYARYVYRGFKPHKCYSHRTYYKKGP